MEQQANVVYAAMQAAAHSVTACVRDLGARVTVMQDELTGLEQAGGGTRKHVAASVFAKATTPDNLPII